MRRLAFIAFFFATCGLVGCGPATSGPVSGGPLSGQTARPSPSAPAAGLPATAVRLVTSTLETMGLAEPAVTVPALSSEPLPADPPTPTVTPSPLAPTATAEPTPPPLSQPEEGRPLDLSVTLLLSANGHLTTGTTARLDREATHILTSLGGTVYALRRDGEIRWQARTEGPVYARALLDGDRVAAGDDAGYVHLLESSGRRLARRDFDSRITSLEAWQGGLLVAGWDGQLTLLDADGRAVVWQTAAGGPVTYLATLPELAVAATLGGPVSAYDAKGRLRWEMTPQAPVGSLGAVPLGKGGRIVLGLRDGSLLALGPDGQTLWHRVLGRPSGGAPVWQAVRLAQGEEPVIVAGTGGEESALVLLSARGETLWRRAMPAAVGAVSAADLDNDGEAEILAGLADSQVVALDPEGRRRGSVRTGLGVTGLEPDGEEVLVRADVTAWRLRATPGETGGIWLPPPALMPASAEGTGGALQSVGQLAGEGQVSLVFVGDVGLGRTMEANLARYGHSYPWAGLGPLLSEAGLAVANLEGVLTTQGHPLDKPYLIRAHPHWGQALQAAGFDLVTLANNHALDFGQPGLDETIDTLDSLGIEALGAGRTAQEARQPAVFDSGGVRVALLAYAAERWNGSDDVPATDLINWAGLWQVQTDVQAAREESDLVIVLLHAGTEYALKPSADQVAVAHAAIEAGAGLVVGHHPHVTQTVERYGGGLIVYSLGDALFDIPRRAAMRGHLLRVIVGEEGLVAAELWPFWIEDAIRPRLLDDGQGRARVRVMYP